ncbi:hypothetical protein C1752_10485 [Acaryochloris thomasi RCC1774]|uniref:Uncharacterized protein n=1 Tax=Acaryochloris thomasi RCC1774 TaxID=1764569 RepID=A0A2W1JG67_9CYAN|nr:hypothetical protein [Acaryochloris thomasi]PZD70635.1 hypothetical protein C1752_10485 [Acaryochloris thomasi RCC1774]
MTASTPNDNSTEQQLLAKLEVISKQLEQNKKQLKQNQQQFELFEQRSKWDDRAWRVIQFAGGASITLSVAASLGLLFLIARVAFGG